MGIKELLKVFIEEDDSIEEELVQPPRDNKKTDFTKRKVVETKNDLSFNSGEKISNESTEINNRKIVDLRVNDDKAKVKEEVKEEEKVRPVTESKKGVKPNSSYRFSGLISPINGSMGAAKEVKEVVPVAGAKIEKPGYLGTIYSPIYGINNQDFKPKSEVKKDEITIDDIIADDLNVVVIEDNKDELINEDCSKAFEEDLFNDEQKAMDDIEVDINAIFEDDEEAVVEQEVEEEFPFEKESFEPEVEEELVVEKEVVKPLFEIDDLDEEDVNLFNFDDEDKD
ncbi:MAG: hypothetical protein WBO70_03965 [Erysipelotrichaceae bacterium]